MTVKEAQSLRSHEFVTDGCRKYRVGHYKYNYHDLWFWHCKRGSQALIVRGGGRCTRVYLGSENLEPDNVEFLAQLTKC